MDIYLESESEEKVMIFKYIQKVRVEHGEKVNGSARVCKMELYLESESEKSNDIPIYWESVSEE